MPVFCTKHGWHRRTAWNGGSLQPPSLQPRRCADACVLCGCCCGSCEECGARRVCSMAQTATNPAKPLLLVQQHAAGHAAVAAAPAHAAPHARRARGLSAHPGISCPSALQRPLHAARNDAAPAATPRATRTSHHWKPTCCAALRAPTAPPTTPLLLPAAAPCSACSGRACSMRRWWRWTRSSWTSLSTKRIGSTRGWS